VELEEAVREVLDTEDEEASSRAVDGNGLRRSHPEDGNDE
jgi:hypothetical protein